MRPSPRVTRSFYTRVPRWSTNYPTSFNWTLVSFWDVFPLLVAVAFVSAYSAAFVPLVIVCVLWLCVRLVLRRRRRAGWCAEHGHDPYRPTPEVPYWRCYFCDAELDDAEEASTIDEALARAGAVGTARLDDAPQARWSDRR